MVYPSKKELLEDHPLFESLSWWQFKNLASAARVIEVPKGNIILEEGEKGNALYIVLSGRCVAYQERNGQKKRLEQYHNGESFGETSLLAEQTNWATVQALNDTLLVKIDKEHIDELTKNNASISRQISEKIASHVSQQEDQYDKASSSRIVSIGSGIEEIGKTLLGINCAIALKEETEESICVVDFTRNPEEDVNEIPTGSVNLTDWFDSVSRDHPSGITVMPVTLPPNEKKDIIGPFFGAFVAKYNYVFIILPEGLSPVVLEVYEQSDQILLLTDIKEQTLYQTRLLISNLLSEFNFSEEDLRIILSRISPSDMPKPSGAEDTLNYPVSYRLPEISDTKILSPLTERGIVEKFPDHRYSVNVRRIARRIGDISVGLALGAGAARGLSHIGVMKVLEEENVHVDYVAGSSIGALIAAGWAIGAGPDEMKEFAYEFKNRGGLWSIGDLSFPPTKSILRDGHITKFLNYMLGDATFSDTEFPVKIVAANIDRLEEETIDEGLLVDAVRKSISIPMMFPPVNEDGELIVDGGVLNPIPVSTLANAGTSRIIAVNPIPPLKVLRESKHLKTQTKQTGLWNWIKRQILPFGKGNIIDTFMRSLQAMQARLAASSCAGADVVINPIVSTEEWFEFGEVETFIEQGEMTARQHLDEIKSIIKEPTTKQFDNKN